MFSKTKVFVVLFVLIMTAGCGSGSLSTSSNQIDVSNNSHSNIIGTYIVPAGATSISIDNIIAALKLAPNTYTLIVSAIDTAGVNIAFTQGKSVVISSDTLSGTILSWSVPKIDVDGNVLIDGVIKGYKIYCVFYT